MTPNVKKIAQRNKYMFSEKQEFMNIDTHHFYPFYVFLNWEVEKNEPIYCDYCGELINGNGNYSCDYFIFENANDIRICCSRKCMTGHVWDYNCQYYGQSQPLCLPQNSTIEQRMVYYTWFGSCSASYHVMKYSKIDINQFKEIVSLSEASGGTYNHDDARFIEFRNNKLSIFKDFDDSHICTITLSQIVKVVNQMLLEMKVKQLSLF